MITRRCVIPKATDNTVMSDKRFPPHYSGQAFLITFLTMFFRANVHHGTHQSPSHQV